MNFYHLKKMIKTTIFEITQFFFRQQKQILKNCQRCLPDELFLKVWLVLTHTC